MRPECASDRVFNAEGQISVVQTFHVWVPSRRRSVAKALLRLPIMNTQRVDALRTLNFAASPSEC